MPDIQGIEFDSESVNVVNGLIERMKAYGVFDICPHPNMSHHKGELWLAHRAADPQHKLARGIFARFIPCVEGVKFTHKQNGIEGVTRTLITPRTIEAVYTSMVTRYEETKYL